MQPGRGRRHRRVSWEPSARGACVPRSSLPSLLVVIGARARPWAPAVSPTGCGPWTCCCWPSPRSASLSRGLAHASNRRRHWWLVTAALAGVRVQRTDAQPWHRRPWLERAVADPGRRRRARCSRMHPRVPGAPSAVRRHAPRRSFISSTRRADGAGDHVLAVGAGHPPAASATRSRPAAGHADPGGALSGARRVHRRRCCCCCSSLVAHRQRVAAVRCRWWRSPSATPWPATTVRRGHDAAALASSRRLDRRRGVLVAHWPCRPAPA